METFGIGWSSRVTGLAVLGGVIALAAWLATSGGAPGWTWAVLGGFGLASALATNANLGDRFHVDAESITYENVLSGRLGLPRERRIPWSRVLHAVEHDHRAWFLEVEDERRLVLDQLAEHDRFRTVLEARGITVSVVVKPRPWAGRGDRPGPA